MSQLLDAVRSGELETVKQRVANGENVNAREGQDSNDATALMRAAEGGHTDIVKLLLEHGADINATWNVGGTALQMIAGNENSTAIVKLLLEKGADVNAKDDYGQTALTSASVYNRTQNVELLLEHGAEINATTVDGSTALSRAVKYACIESIKILLENGADVNDQLLGLTRNPTVVEMLCAAARTPRPVPAKNQPHKAQGMTAEPQEAWQRFKCYVQVPKDVPDTEVRPNMRFQFMFSSEITADRILASIPEKHIRALNAGKCWWRGMNPEGKFQIAWDGVRLSIADGKDLMNTVVSQGGEIYEAFLT